MIDTANDPLLVTQPLGSQIDSRYTFFPNPPASLLFDVNHISGAVKMSDRWPRVFNALSDRAFLATQQSDVLQIPRDWLNFSRVMMSLITAWLTSLKPISERQRSIESVDFGAAHASLYNILWIFTMQLTLIANIPVYDGHTFVDHCIAIFSVDTAAEFNLAYSTGQAKIPGKVAALHDSPSLDGESHGLATPKRCNCPFDCGYCCSCCWRCTHFCAACWVVESPHCSRKHSDASNQATHEVHADMTEFDCDDRSKFPDPVAHTSALQTNMLQVFPHMNSQTMMMESFMVLMLIMLIALLLIEQLSTLIFLLFQQTKLLQLWMIQ